MLKQVLSVTPAGTTGSATGSDSVVLSRGYVLDGVYINYTSVTSDTVVRLQLVDPPVTMLVIETNATDGWYFPRKNYCTSTGASYSSWLSSIAEYPIMGTLVARVSTSTPTTNGVKFYCWFKDV
jgi:hypothetical protein